MGGIRRRRRRRPPLENARRRDVLARSRPARATSELPLLLSRQSQAHGHRRRGPGAAVERRLARARRQDGTGHGGPPLRRIQQRRELRCAEQGRGLQSSEVERRMRRAKALLCAFARAAAEISKDLGDARWTLPVEPQPRYALRKSQTGDHSLTRLAPWRGPDRSWACPRCPWYSSRQTCQ